MVKFVKFLKNCAYLRAKLEIFKEQIVEVWERRHIEDFNGFSF